MGLTCSGTFALRRRLPDHRRHGRACDPLNGTIRCPGEQVCIAHLTARGTCGAATGMEMEPNDSPAAVAWRAITAPSAFRGAAALRRRGLRRGHRARQRLASCSVSDGNGRCPAPFQGGIALDLYGTDGTTVRGVVTTPAPSACCATIDGGRSTVHAFAGGLAAGTYTVCARPVRDTTTTTGPVPNYVLTVAPYGAM
jgi:hypothetical protein